MSGATRTAQLVSLAALTMDFRKGGDVQKRGVALLAGRTFEELLQDVFSALDDCRVCSMVVGSFASTYHGIPRSTQDLDVVVELDAAQLDELLVRWREKRYYVGEEAAREALHRRTQFNLIDPLSGWEVDFIVRKEHDFSKAEFARRELAELQGQPVRLATAEDTIIAKLLWARDSRSERQLRDIAGILDVSGETLDHAYLQGWVEKLNLGALLEQARGPW